MVVLPDARRGAHGAGLATGASAVGPGGAGAAAARGGAAAMARGGLKALVSGRRAAEVCRAMSSQLTEYVPVLLLALVAVGFAVGTLFLSVLVGSRTRRNPVKDTAYECGMPPMGEATPRFSVKFYLVAMLFILFDI